MNQSKNKAIALSIVSFISGILSLLFFLLIICLRSQGLWCIAGCVIFSVTGLVLSAVSLRKPCCITSLCLAGMITSIFSLVLLLILILLIAALFIFFADFINAISGLGRIG